MYKVYDNKCEELNFTVKKTPDNIPSSISGRFIVDHTKNVKIAISHNYHFEDNLFNSLVSNVYVLTLSPLKLAISKKYEVMQNKLHDAFANSEQIKDKKRMYFLNYLVDFYTDNNNEDQLVFQSRSVAEANGMLNTKIQNIGIFNFDVDGKISKFNLVPLK